MVEAESDQLCVPAFLTSTLFLLWWHGAQPRTPERDIVPLSQSEILVVLRIYLFIYSFARIFVWALQSNIQLHEHGWLLETSCKGFGNMDVFILHCYSQDYLKEDYLELIFISVFLHARDSVSIGSLYGPISNLVWFPWWLRHGAMDPVEGTTLWETWNERTLEFTLSNLVIRLRKVQDGLFSRLTIGLVKLLAADTGHHLSLASVAKLCRMPWNLHSLSAYLDTLRYDTTSCYHCGDSTATGRTTFWTSGYCTFDLFDIFWSRSLLDISGYHSDSSHARGTTPPTRLDSLWLEFFEVNYLTTVSRFPFGSFARDTWSPPKKDPACRCVCVCVEHLNRCKTSNHSLNSRGCRRHWWDRH